MYILYFFDIWKLHQGWCLENPYEDYSCIWYFSIKHITGLEIYI